MRIFLIQHGLRDRHTHFYGETLGWTDQLRCRQIEHRVFCHEKAAAEIAAECGAVPLFSFASGARVAKDPVTDQLETFLRFASAFAGDCTGIADDMSAHDVVIVALATEREVYGAARWLATIPEMRRPHLVFHFVTPDFRWAVSEDRNQLKGDIAFHRFAAAQLAEFSNRFHFFAGTEKLSQTLQRVFNQPVAIAPLPMTYPAASDLQASSEDPLWKPAHIGFVGEYRREKGGAILPEIIERYCRERPDRRIFLQVQNERQGELAREQLGHLDDLDIHAGPLSQRGYVTRLETLDIVLLPYMPARYAIRSSGVFAESVAYGLVSVVPQKTWMSDQLTAGHGAGVAFAEMTAESVARAVIAASDDFPRLKEKAMTGRATWRASQSLDVFLDRILEQVKSRS